MDDLTCPRCKTAKYRKPNLKLLINTCGHGICENCVDILFHRGSANCPICDIPLRRNNYRVQIYENTKVEREIDIRKKVMRYYNKQEDDFPDLRSYNDYLEELESIVYKLTNGIDVDEINRKMEDYKKKNIGQIKKNWSKLSSEEQRLNSLIEEESELMEWNRNKAVEREREEDRRKYENKKNLIDSLSSSDLPASVILKQHQSKIKEAENISESTEFSTGIKIGKREPSQKVPLPAAAPLFVYEPLFTSNVGPPEPSYDLLDQYVKFSRESHPRELAGGYMIHLSCERALHEAFSGLFYFHEEKQSDHDMSVGGS